MIMRRSAAVIGATMASVGVFAVTSAPAGAASGSNPNGAFCKLEKSSSTLATSKTAVAASKALIAGNWKLAQKDLLSVDKQDASVTKQFSAALSSAPANVKAAAQQLIKLEPQIVNAVKNAKSASQFEKTELALTNSPTFSSAGQTIIAYNTAQCGSNTSPSAS
jgi:hypothetical protein